MSDVARAVASDDAVAMTTDTDILTAARPLEVPDGELTAHG